MTTWHGTEWHGMARHGTARHGTAQHGTARHGMERHGTPQHGTARHNAARHGTTRHGTAWHGTILKRAENDCQRIRKTANNIGKALGEALSGSILLSFLVKANVISFRRSLKRYPPAPSGPPG